MQRRFGMRLDGWMTPAHCIELAVAAEACGFDAVWYAENPFGRGVLPAMAAAGHATRRIQHAIGVFNPFNRHPSLIAMEMAALDELLGGRAIIGLGIGVRRMLEKAHLGSEKPIAAMRDAIAIIRGLLRGEAVFHEGTVFSSSGVKLEFPVLRPDCPILVASMGDQSIRMAGDIADGLMISNLCTPGFTARALRLIAGRAGRRQVAQPLRVVQYAPCVARPDRAEARDAARDVLGAMIARSFAPTSSPQLRAWHQEGSGIAEAEFMELARRIAAGEPARRLVSDRLLDLYTVAGNADDCVAAYARYLEVGVTEVVVTFRDADPKAGMAYLADALRSFA